MVDSMHKDLSRSLINRALLQSFATQTYLGKGAKKKLKK